MKLTSASEWLRLGRLLFLAVWLGSGATLAFFGRAMATMVAAPSPWYGLFFGVLWLLPVYACLSRSRARTAWPLAAAFLVYLVLGLGLPWSEGDRFLWRLEEIEPGMSVPEVSDRMGGHEDGLPFNPNEDDVYTQGEDWRSALFRSSDLCKRYRHSEPGREFDIAYVCFAQGRVTGTDFHPD